MGLISNLKRIEENTVLISTRFAFREGLQLGATKHWSQTLELLTGESKMNASAILEYFDPLYQYLKQKNSEEESSGASQITHSALFAFVCVIGVFTMYKYQM